MYLPVLDGRVRASITMCFAITTVYNIKATMDQNLTQQLVNKVTRYIFLGLLAYMPLHIFLSTWVGTSFGVLEFAKVFKDIVLLAGFCLALFASIKQSWFKQIVKERLVWIILAYCALNIV